MICRLERKSLVSRKLLLSKAMGLVGNSAQEWEPCRSLFMALCGARA